MTGKPTNIRWLIFLVLALASFVSYVLRANISIAAPTMIEEFGLTEIQWGWILAAFTTGYGIFQIPGGVFGEVFGWFYYYLVEVREFDPTDVGWVTASQWVAGGAGAALGGWLCDRLCKKLGLR